MSNNTTDDIKKEAEEVVALVRQLNNVNSQIAENEQFRTLLQQQKSLTEQIELFWETIKNGMIATDTKNIKGDWGYITLVDKTSYQADLDVLPAKFIKKAPDTKKIALAHKLEGKLPKGVTELKTVYLTKKIKEIN